MSELSKEIEKIALTIRSLTIDAVEQAASGHPGLPLGMAEVGALLYAKILKHYPSQPDWIDRDRFVLSAGHGSMLLYALLYLSGYNLTLEDIKNFRQLHSLTPGHPEKGVTAGVETTTGPLGQGLANAVGMAIAERMLAAKFNTPEYQIIDHFTYVLASDGCMMEGVSAEASSLAGHLRLGKLIVFYDSNRITIDGSTELTFTEDVALRYQAYGWKTYRLSAYDLEGILTTVVKAKEKQDRPTLLILDSLIGKGSPHKAGSEKCHGAPLGKDEVLATKRELGLNENEYFYVALEALKYFKEKSQEWEKNYRKWLKTFADWQRDYPELAHAWEEQFSLSSFRGKPVLPSFGTGQKLATRESNHSILNAYAQVYPQLVGGSADLASSTKTRLTGYPDFQVQNQNGRNINFGVREHAMGAVVNGLALHGGFRPYCATFFVFTDYMRPPMRLAALMRLPILYFFSHDSIYVGEDGPTHQPVEQLASLRVIPNLEVWRPADAQENLEVFREAFRRLDGPTALLLTRQGVTVFAKEDPEWSQNVRNGAYIVQEARKRPIKAVLIATGSEVELALKVYAELNRTDLRVISMPCRERFIKLPKAKQLEILPSSSRCVVIEAGVIQGWEAILREDGLFFGLDDFGRSGKADEVAASFGFEARKIAQRLAPLLG